MYSNEEIKHHLAWMRDNTDISPYAITRTWDKWEQGYSGYNNYHVTKWIDYILEENGIIPEWK